MTLEFWEPDFFKIPPKRLRLVEQPNVGRIHIIHKGRIVAVALPEEEPK